VTRVIHSEILNLKVKDELHFRQLFKISSEEYQNNPNIGLDENFREILKNELSKDDKSSLLDESPNKKFKSFNSTFDEDLDSDIVEIEDEFNSEMYREILRVKIEHEISKVEYKNKLNLISKKNEESIEIIEKLFNSPFLKTLLLMKLLFSFDEIEEILSKEFEKFNLKEIRKNLEDYFPKELEEYKLSSLREQYSKKFEFFTPTIKDDEESIFDKSIIKINLGKLNKKTTSFDFIDVKILV
jgi:hypothetical protein